MTKDLLTNQYRLWFIAILSTAAFVRLAFLGYSTLTDEEAQVAEFAAYVLPCLKELSFSEAMWRQLHLYPDNKNPFLNLYPINIPIVWFFGLSEFNIRVEAAIGGFLSCILIYFLVLRHSDKKTALFAMALVALNPFMITFNRYALGDSLQTAIFLLGLFFIDRFLEKRRVILLVLCSFCFAISFLLKANAIIFICLAMFLYYVYMRLRLRDIGIILVGSIVTVTVPFLDQLNVFLPSIAYWSDLPSLLEELKKPGIMNLLIERISKSWFYTRAHVFYFEHSVFPLLGALLFFKQIKNKFFRVLLLFGILYFLALYVPGRTFFRYMQIGMIMTSAAFAFVLARFADRRYSYIGSVLIVAYLIWGLVAHGTYVFSQYQHVPYKYIKQRIHELGGSGRIVIFGANHEAGYYLSPTSHLWFDETVDPCQVPVTMTTGQTQFAERAHGVKKVPADFSVLLDPNAVKPGDLLLVAGIQMSGGEPNPLSLGIKKWGITLWGIRQYGHGYLKDVRAFYEEYKGNKRLQDQYVLLEKVYLSNGSDELAALILEKT